jgi:hypothetical protein
MDDLHLVIGPFASNTGNPRTGLAEQLDGGDQLRVTSAPPFEHLSACGDADSVVGLRHERRGEG